MPAGCRHGQTILSGTLTGVPAGLLLSFAITVEVCATLALRASDGLSRLVPALFVVAGYATSFWLLSLVLRDISVGTSYAIWSGVGTAALAIIGMAALGEPTTALKIASIALIIAGVIGLSLAGAH
jgi:small multidrug resistance pump